MDNNSVNALVVNENALKEAAKQPGKWKKLILPLIFLILIGVVIYEVIVGIQSLSFPNSSQNEGLSSQDMPLTSPLPIGDAVLALISDKSEYQVGEKIPVVVQLSTSGNLVGNVSVVIKYDPKLVSLEGDNFFTNGNVYQINPLITKDAAKGILRISADAGSPLNGFSGVGNVGVVNFTAQSAGNSNFNLENSSGNSQVINQLSKKNILGSVVNLSVQVK